MPRIAVRGAGLHYEEHGAGPETVVFAHGLLWSGRLFDRQVEALAPHYRCVTFDFRGHGRSEATADGYDMDSGSRLRVLPGAGHTSTIEEPAEVNAAIADFLGGLR